MLKVKTVFVVVMISLPSGEILKTIFGLVYARFINVNAYKALVRPSLLYGSEIWRPWTAKTLKLLDSFQNRFIRRVAWQCNVSCDAIPLRPIVDILDGKDIKLAHSLIVNNAVPNFFEVRKIFTRFRVTFVTPRAINNTILNSFRCRASRALSKSMWYSYMISPANY